MLLSSLKSLVRLYAFNTSVTKEGTDKLRQLLPNCRAKWKPAPSSLPDDQFDSDNDDLNALSMLPDGLRSMLDIAGDTTTDDEKWQTERSRFLAGDRPFGLEQIW